MKIFLPIILFVLSFQAIAQVPQYRTINAELIINATKDGEAYRFLNKNILVNLDYKTGNFLLNLSNTDFNKIESEVNVNPLDSISQKQQFSFSGILPISQIIDQQTTEQNYAIELQLTNTELMINQTLNISLTVTLPNASGKQNYRIFVMNGLLYNNQLQLPAFHDFDNEIQFWVQFSGISTSN